MIHLTTLKNGIRVAVVPISGLKSTTVEIMVKMGARWEENDEQGMSHFLEHMAFKGTKKRLNATDIFREIDSLGASFDAETGYETTSYSITTVHENLKWSLELLSDIFFRSVYPRAEVAREKGVIVEEINMYEDNPVMGLGAEMVQFLYGESNRGCWNISGSRTQVRNVTQQGLISFRNKYYDPRRVVVVVAGEVKEKDLKLVERYFEEEMVAMFEDDKMEIKLTKKKLKRVISEKTSGHFVLALPTFGSLDKRRYALRLLETILVGNASSLLFEEIRTKRGLAYYVMPIGENLMETGFCGIQVGTAVDKLEETIEVAVSQMTNIEKLVNEELLARAKSYVWGRTRLAMDRSEYWTYLVAQRLLMRNEVLNLEEELKNISKVSLSEVKEIGKEYFVKSKLIKYILGSK